VIIESTTEPGELRQKFTIIEAGDKELFSLPFLIEMMKNGDPEAQECQFGHKAGWVEVHLRGVDGREVVYHLTGIDYDNRLSPMVLKGVKTADTEWKKL
jgi:hypothetical protein